MSYNNKKVLFASVGGLTVAFGLCIYIYSQKQGKKDRIYVDATIDRATIIKVLKELKKEMFSVFQNFSAVSMNIKQQSMGRAKPEEIKMMLLEQPMFRGEIDSVEDSVYSSYGLAKDQVQHLCENVYREDQEIKELQKQMKQAFDNCFLGIAPDSKTDIPDFLTANKTFEILEKVMLESAIALNGKLLELQEQGEQISFNNPKMMEIMSSLKMDNSKKEILKVYGLDKFEEPGPKILQHATQTYTKENRDGFKEKLSKLDVKYQQIMEQILMGGPISSEELKIQMNREVENQPFMGIGAFGGLRSGTDPQREKPQQQEMQQPKKESQKEVVNELEQEELTNNQPDAQKKEGEGNNNETEQYHKDLEQPIHQENDHDEENKEIYHNKGHDEDEMHNDGPQIEQQYFKNEKQNEPEYQ